MIEKRRERERASYGSARIRNYFRGKEEKEGYLEVQKETEELSWP